MNENVMPENLLEHERAKYRDLERQYRDDIVDMLDILYEESSDPAWSDAGRSAIRKMRARLLQVARKRFFELR